MSILLLAWSWTGHGQLTEMGVAFAIAQFLIQGSKSVLKRFFDIENMRTKQREELKRIPGNATSDAGQISAEQSMSTRLQQEQVPQSVARTVMTRLFSDLPGRVQTEDIHPGNIPSIGETLERDSQVRHFMRSRVGVTPKQAFDASTKYIRDNCIKSWSALRLAVKHEKSWKDFFSDSTLSDFEEGKALLAKALHALEDSYAPGHVKRSEGCTGIVESVNIWDEENKKPSGDWPGHEALDNPQSEQSRHFFDSARRATGDLISFILLNLEVEESDFLRELDKLMATRFTFSPLGPGDFPASPSQTVRG